MPLHARRLRHRDAHFDTSPGPARGRDAEGEQRAVGDARREGNGQGLTMTGMTGAVAALARVAPHFPTSPATSTGQAHLHLERHRRANSRLSSRQMNLGSQRVHPSIRFNEGVAHPLDFVAHCRKVDRDLVGERTSKLAIKGARSLDSDPPIMHAPLVFHEPDRSVGVLSCDVNS